MPRWKGCRIKLLFSLKNSLGWQRCVWSNYKTSGRMSFRQTCITVVEGWWSAHLAVIGGLWTPLDTICQLEGSHATGPDPNKAAEIWQNEWKCWCDPAKVRPPPECNAVLVQMKEQRAAHEDKPANLSVMVANLAASDGGFLYWFWLWRRFSLLVLAEVFCFASASDGVFCPSSGSDGGFLSGSSSDGGSEGG